MSENTKQLILDGTRQGLDVFIKLFPECASDIEVCATNSRKAFKLRSDEKTASARIKINKAGEYVITDFGGDGKAKNCFDLVQELHQTDFKGALKWIGDTFGLFDGSSKKKNTYEFTTRPATAEEKEGDYTFNFKDEITDAALKTLFSINVIKNKTPEELRKVCSEFQCRQLNYYTKIAVDKVTGALMYRQFSATDTYHIFAFDHDTWKKIIQPNREDKNNRFFYHGAFPKDHINGRLRCIAALDKLKQDHHKKNKALEKLNEPIDKDEPLLKAIIKCTGERDALNVAALGHQVIFLNGESARLHGDDYKEIKGMCKHFYNLGDIDDNGKKQLHDFGMVYLQTRNIRLPEELKKHRDFRGNACKDVRDYLNYYTPSDFNRLLKIAYPYQFWEERWNPKFQKTEYSVNNAFLYHFLQYNGFYRYHVQNKKDGETYVQIEGNIVREVRPNKIRDYVTLFLRQRHMEVEVINTFYRSPQMSEASLNNLPFIEIDFSDFDKHSQYMFFKNCTVHITATDIKIYKPGDLKKYVWEEEVIPHNFTLMDAPWKIEKMEETIKS